MSIELKSKDIISKIKSADTAISLKAIGRIRESGSSSILSEIIKIKDALINSDEQKVYLLNGLLMIISDLPDEQEFTK